MADSTPIKSAATLLQRFSQVRRQTEDICNSLNAEDALLQAMPDVSPPKWHLAHTSWFFDRFLIRGGVNPPPPIDPIYDVLFNSYYESAGSFHPRAQRGLISRPELAQVMEYRQKINALVARCEPIGDALDVLELGLNHEQQHQELLITDIKYNFFSQPLQPAFRPRIIKPPRSPARGLEWEIVPEGVYEVGCDDESFAFDNEHPAHRVYLNPIAMANRLSTNREYLDFIESGGYSDFRLWLSEGWSWVQAHDIDCPLYWKRDAHGSWMQFTLHGWEPLDLDQPVCHLSYFESDAFARWSGARLPTEFEWETLARQYPPRGQFLDLDNLSPASSSEDNRDIFGTLWEWTSSSYGPYPGYKPLSGSLGEYNGKFMSNQYVLRGGSCATPNDHIRVSYRNFFPTTARWQFAGVRLAKDLV